VISLLALWHENGYAHRDLKPHNITVGLEDVGEFMFIDMGTVCKFEEGQPMTGRVGTTQYMSPQMERKEEYNHKTGRNLFYFDLFYHFFDLKIRCLFPWIDSYCDCFCNERCKQ